MADRKRLLLLKKKLLLLKRQSTTQRYHRRYWVHPINRKRENFGIFAHLINELRNDELRFKKYFRMAPETLIIFCH
ncbi:hypothetical protein EB796_024365 [Bugula neritina]|uniref:Uncharacterized protein n=1 Tax=Bugula neritina TaxID=10212 RepID=A0A7J7IVQ5_BUGNE|nr:hypothetical protein EB796_024365 [Bugula neritina]